MADSPDEQMTPAATTDAMTIEGVSYPWRVRYADSGYAVIDLMAHLLGPEHCAYLRSLARTHAVRVVKRGRGPGSLEPEETAGLDYRVVTGRHIRHLVPWFWRDATDTISRMVSAALGLPCTLSQDVDSAININWVSGLGGRYELHTDSAHSALLFLSTLQPDEGGALYLEPPGHPAARVTPQEGRLVIFRGECTPHAVEPLARADLERFSMPLAYTSPAIIARPQALSAYLYTPQQTTRG